VSWRLRRFRVAEYMLDDLKNGPVDLRECEPVMPVRIIQGEGAPKMKGCVKCGRPRAEYGYPVEINGR